MISDLTGFEGSWWTLPPDATKAEMREALERMLDAYRSHGRLVRAITDAAIYDAEIRVRFNGLVNGVATATAEHLRQGQRAGVVSRELDPDHTAFSLTWMLERGFSLLLYPAEPAELERRLDAAAETIWDATRGSAI